METIGTRLGSLVMSGFEVLGFRASAPCVMV